MPKQQRPEGAAPLGSRAFYEKVNPYWNDRAADRAANPKQKAQATSHKSQVTSEDLTNN